MWDRFGFWGRLCFVACSSSVVLVACGSDNGGDALLAQAPHCSKSGPVFAVEGKVGDQIISDLRTDNVNAGYENVPTGKFYTPLTTLAPLDQRQVAMTLTWSSSLLHGESAQISGGSFIPPEVDPPSYPHAAPAPYCVSKGRVGFVSGGDEDGVFKFAISELKQEADCSGAPLAVDLRGCLE